MQTSWRVALLCGAFCPQSPSCIYFHSNLFCSWFAEIGIHYTLLIMVVLLEGLNFSDNVLRLNFKEKPLWCKQARKQVDGASRERLDPE